MSKNRFDRRRKPEEWDTDYVALGGGLDQSSSALTIKPGRVVQAQNWEEVFGKQGYSTVRGYERFDGRARPSEAGYTVVRFDAGSAAVDQGDTVTNAGAATGIAVSQTIESGSLAGGDAAGYLIVCEVSGSWSDNDPIQVGGVTRATAAGASETGSIGFPAHVASLRATRTYLRGLIEKVPGEGGVLGCAVYEGVVYAVRNIVGGASATLWKATASGWTSVQAGLHPGGAYKFWSANFTGDPTRRYLFGVNGRGRLFRLDTAGTVTKADPIYGTEALSTSNVAYGTGAKAFTVETGKGFEVGDEVTLWDADDAANFMAGAVTAYNSGTGQLDVNVTSSSGAGSNNNWEAGLSDYSDKPFLVREHKNHLFLAYPSGQLQTSALGDPMSYTGGTVALFGMGKEITGMTSLRGEMLAIFMREGIKILRGSTSLDWDMGPYSDKVGAIADTLQDNGGNSLFLDSKGLTTLQATQAFGDYASSVLSQAAKAYLDARLTNVVGSRMATDNFQYRLYFGDKTVLRATIKSTAETIGAKDISFMASLYLHTPTCFAAGVMADDGEDRMFFGTSDGYVMEEDAGTSFDGTAILYVLRLPANHFKMPQFIKQFHKLELELEVSDPEVTINFRQIFDYDDQTYRFGFGEVSTEGIGGQFDVDAWDTFQFDQPTNSRAEQGIDGQGRNMGLLLFLESDHFSPVVLQGVLTYFTQLGMQR